jgi:Fe-S cluster biogenesis protein NfuA
MFIQTESTANPAALKFVPGRAVLGEGSVEFRDADEARRSPLAQRLFAIPAITRVALGGDFITVTKDQATDWQVLKPAILGVIMEHFVAGRPVIAEAGAVDDTLTASVRDMIEARIRPAVEGARGTVGLRSFEAGVATVELGGAPASNATFRNGIENMLRHYIPEVEEVRFVAVARDPAADPAAKEAGLDTPAAITIQALLDDEINPSVAAHGGHVDLVAVRDKRVYLRLGGGCQGCGMANVTLRQGIEVAILDKVPEIEEILDVTDHAGGTNPYYEGGGHHGHQPYA